MLKITIVSLVLLTGVFWGGCQTVTKVPTQQTHKYSRIADLNRRMLGDDIDALLLLDRPSRLTQWHVRSQ